MVASSLVPERFDGESANHIATGGGAGGIAFL
jgi:hypothetical protein